MPIYLPDEFAMWEQAYGDEMARLRSMAFAAAKDESEARMEKTYSAELGALTISSFGDLGEEERRYRSFLAQQLAEVCFKWDDAGGRIYDVSAVCDELQPWCIEPFEDLRSSDVFKEICYVHLGEGIFAGAHLQSRFHHSGFFIQPAELDGDRGTSLTFYCSPNSGNVEQELGSLLLAKSPTALAWISHAELGNGVVRPKGWGDPLLPRDRTLPRVV